MFNAYPLVLSRGLAEEMKHLGVSDDGVEIMTRKSTFVAVMLENVPLRLAILLKQEALASGADFAVPGELLHLREGEYRGILFGPLPAVERTCEKMRMQPFKGRLLAEEVMEAIENSIRTPQPLRLRTGDLDFSRVRIMGILNVTPDSFSDGGRYMDVEAAVERAKRMVEEGADIVDVGGESTRPFSKPVPVEEERRRVIPVLERLLDEIDVPISVDTYKPEIAREALEMGAHMINDITGLGNPEMRKVVADFGVPAVIMHMKGTPRDMQVNPHYENVVSEIISFLRERVRMAREDGVEQVIVDPGIGFGKRTEDNLRILRSLFSFRALGLPVLVGTSRKSFIGNVLNLPVEERLEGTLATLVVSVLNGASILRVHDVKEAVRAVRMAEAVMGCMPLDGG